MLLGPTKHGQRAQIKLGLCNGPEIRHLELKIALSKPAVHKITFPFRRSHTLIGYVHERPR